MSKCHNLDMLAGTVGVTDKGVMISPTTLDVEDLYLSPEKAVELAVEILAKWPRRMAEVLGRKHPETGLAAEVLKRMYDL